MADVHRRERRRHAILFQIDIKDLSAREIEDIADKAAKKENLKELNRVRVSPSLNHEAKIFMISRLSIPADRIAARLKVNRRTALKYFVFWGRTKLTG